MTHPFLGGMLKAGICAIAIAGLFGIAHNKALAVSTPTFVKLKGAHPTANTSNVSTGNFSGSVTSGNSIIVWLWYNSSSQSVASVSDTKGNSYFKAVGPTTGTGAMSNWRQEIWYAKNITGGSSFNVTATFSGSFNAEKSITAHEYSGIDAASPVDTTAAAVTTTANSSTGSVITNYQNDLIFGASLLQISGSQGSGFTRRSSVAGNVSEDKIAVTPGSYAATFTNSAQVAISQAVAFKAAGNTPDTTAPSTPTNLSTTPISSSQINLTWTASTDNVGVAGYKVFRDSLQIATSTTNNYSNSGLSPNTSYTYTIQAYDAASNLSSLSSPAVGTTPPPADTTPPIISAVTSTTTQTTANISWLTNEASDSQVDYGPTVSYGQSSVLNGTLLTNHTVNLSLLSPGSTYHYRVRSKDASNNTALSSDFTFITTTPPPDATAPTTPTNLQIFNIGSNSVSANWTASTDNVGVTGYKVFRDNAQIATTTTTNYSDNGLTASTTYTYAVSAFDLAGNISGLSGSQIVTTLPPGTGPAFPLKLSPNSRYLTDQNNIPFPIMGRTAWFVISLPVTDYQTFINDTVARGYNSVEMHVIDHDPRGNQPPFAGNGTAPFLKRLDGTNWNGVLGGSAPDFTTPNEAYWAYVDDFLNYCESRGLVVFMFPAYVGYAGGEQGWMQEMTANGQTKMETYGSWIANRYKNQKNLVWMMGGDMGSFTAPQLSAETGLLNGMKSVPAQQSTFFSAEWDSGMIATDQINFGSQMNLNGVYTWSGEVPIHGPRAYAYNPVMPSFLLEEPYDEEGPDGNNVNESATQPVRRFQWTGVLTTIGGYISGNGYIWRFNSGWQSHLDTQGSRDMAVLNNFLKTIQWYNLVPSGQNGMQTLITAGAGTPFSSSYDYVSAAATPAKNLLVAYIPPAHSGSITVDMTAMGGATVARWFNPVTAAYTTISGSPFSNIGTRQFTPPGNNGSGYSDWVLVLEHDAVPDTQAPTIPTNLLANAVSSSQINLSWSASTDNVGVAGYKIFRNGNQISTTTLASFADTGLTASTTYSYAVSAFDASGNASPQSTEIQATTSEIDTTAPSVPANLAATNVSSNSATISWSPSTDNVLVFGYRIYRDGILTATTSQTSFTNSQLSPLTSYSYTVAAYDGSGNMSSQSAPLLVTTLQAPVVPPSFVQANQNEIVSGTANSVSFAQQNTAGNLIVIYVIWNNTAAVTLTDLRGNVYQNAVGPTTWNGSQRAQIFYAKNILGGANTVTATFSAPINQFGIMYIHEYAGADRVSPLDAVASASGNGTSMNSGNLTTTSPNDLIFGGGASANNVSSAGSGFTLRSLGYGNITEDRAATAAGQYSATANQPNTAWAMLAAAFKAGQ